MGQAYRERLSTIDSAASDVLGDGAGSMAAVEARVRKVYPDENVIAWEGDASTFQFTYVSPSAATILGYPRERWTQEATFWADQVILPADRNEAVAYCALATAKRCDHVFEYRARAADGRIVVVRDIVRVVLGRKGIAERLRGLMFEVTAEHPLELSPEELRRRQAPSLGELEELAASNG